MRDERRSRRASVLLGAVMVGCALFTHPAAAQPAGDVNVQAATLYRSGVKASEENRSDEARAFFLAAWRIKQHWQIAANLGDVEMSSGRYRDAAEHLEFALRTGSQELSPAEKQRIQELLNKTYPNVGRLTVEVSVPEAEVLVNGHPVGKAPLAVPVFVEAGAKVTIEARRDGYAPERVEKSVGAGAQDKVALKLEPVGDGSVQPCKPPEQEPNGSEGPNKKVLVTGIVLSIVAAGVSATGFIAAATAENEEPWKRAGYIGGIGAAASVFFGTGTAIYALASSGSTPKTEEKPTVQVGAYPGGLVVTGTF